MPDCRPVPFVLMGLERRSACGAGRSGSAGLVSPIACTGLCTERATRPTLRHDERARLADAPGGVPAPGRRGPVRRAAGPARHGRRGACGERGAPKHSPIVT